MTKKTIEIIAKKYDVRVSVKKEQCKKIYGLHGFPNDVKKCLAEIEILAPHYFTEKGESGYYLYNGNYSWI